MLPTDIPTANIGLKKFKLRIMVMDLYAKPHEPGIRTLISNCTKRCPTLCISIKA